MQALSVPYTECLLFGSLASCAWQAQLASALARRAALSVLQLVQSQAQALAQTEAKHEREGKGELDHLCAGANTLPALFTALAGTRGVGRLLRAWMAQVKIAALSCR